MKKYIATVTRGLRTTLAYLRNEEPAVKPTPIVLQLPNLNRLSVEINGINRMNGWNVLTPQAFLDPYRVPAALALIHSEASEALEGFRIADRENVGEELADVLIRTLDVMGGLGYDIDGIVAAKLEKNRNRGYKHGGKRI